MTDPAAAGAATTDGATSVPAATRRAWRCRVLPWAWAVALTALLLGPALGPGYVLAHDMVWVPDLGLHRDVFGLGSALPRAVPSDAVVGVLDEVVPGALLQRIVLVGALLLAAGGALRLVGDSLAARLSAVSIAVWSPYVVERLWMGHWTMLLAYGAVPWLVVAGRRTAATGRTPAWAYAVLVAGSLSANAGLACAAALLATGVRRRRAATMRLVLACLAANAPWIVTGLFHAGEAADAAGYEVFAARGDALPAPLSALTLGGIWNADTVPGSRDGAGAWLSLVLVVALAASGVRRWRRRTPRDQRWAIAALWAAGMVVAILSWAAPGALAWLGGHVPGAGLLRDGSRMLLLCLPLLVGLCGAGAETWASGLRGTAPRLAAGLVVVLLPVGLMPDAAGGIGGALAPAHYPSEWARAAAVVRAASVPGDVLVLPWSAYRAPAWNGARVVLDPFPRLLARDSVVSDDLVISGRPVPGEDPRGPRIAAALERPTPQARSDALAAAGIGLVVVERDAGVSAPVVGDVLHRGPLVEVVALARTVAPIDTVDVPGTAERTVVVAAWLAFGALCVVAIGVALAAALAWVMRATGGTSSRTLAERCPTARVPPRGEGGHIP